MANKQKSYHQESGVTDIEAQCVGDNLTLHDAVSYDVRSRRHLAWQSDSKCLLFALHYKSTAK